MVSTSPASPLMDSLGGPLYREVRATIDAQRETVHLLQRLLAGGETEQSILEYFGDETIKERIRPVLEGLR